MDFLHKNTLYLPLQLSAKTYPYKSHTHNTRTQSNKATVTNKPSRLQQAKTHLNSWFNYKKRTLNWKKEELVK